jgi:hypothetical protein
MGFWVGTFYIDARLHTTVALLAPFFVWIYACYVWFSSGKDCLVLKASWAMAAADLDYIGGTGIGSVWFGGYSSFMQMVRIGMEPGTQD